MTEPTFLRSACAECRAEILLETTGYSERLSAIAAQTCASWLCGPCFDRFEAQEQAERNRELSAKVQEAHRTAIQRSGVPRLPSTFDLPPGPASEAALRWAQRRSTTLLIYGPPGTGKSVLAAWAFRSRLEPRVIDGKLRTRPGAWRSMSAYIAALGASFGSREKDDAVWLAQGGIVLGLDDLDKTPPSEFAASAVFALVDGAYSSRSPLIVTMNSQPKALAKKYPGHWGDAIVSRLAEGDVVEYSGPDRRMRRAA